MVKIHILGGPGSGKTTLAQNLSARLQAPRYDLDKIGWKHGEQMEAYIEEAFTIAQQPPWITEGIYLFWTDPLLYYADYIVVLNIPWPVAAWRIIRRHITNSLHGTNPYPGINGIKLLFKLLQFTRHYQLDSATTDPVVAESVRNYLAEQEESDQVPDRELLLKRLEKYRTTIPITADFVRIYLEKYKGKVLFIQNRMDHRHLLERLSSV